MNTDQKTFHEVILTILEFNKKPGNQVTSFDKLVLMDRLRIAGKVLESPGFVVHPETIDLLKTNRDLSNATFSIILSLTLACL